MSVTHKIQPGSLVTWLNTGGSAVLTLTSLADEAARQGAYVDLGASFAEEFGFRLTIKPTAAPDLGTMVRVALGFSPATSGFPGGLSGSDGGLSNPSEAIAQLMELRALVLRNTTDPQVLTGRFRPLGRYVAPVVWLDAIGQNLSSTASDHKLEIWPMPAITE
jgi:hypothetical protein